MPDRFRILLAEDDAGIRESLKELLDFEGYECVPAFDGRDGADILTREGPGRFDLLISDFRMPRLNGGELLQWCRDNNFHFPAIFITANRELVPMENHALRDCCAALVLKPINIDQLIEAIEAARRRHHHEACDGAGTPKSSS